MELYTIIYPLIDGNDTDNHISEKYYLYGEFTALYWIWKNVNISHYGFYMADTYFILNDKYNKNISKPFFSKKNVIKYELNNDNKLNSLCQQYKIILPKQVHIRTLKACNENINSIKDHYNNYIPQEIFNDFILTLEKNNFPFIKELKEYLNSKYYLGLNCFVIEKNIFNEMCKVIFNTAEILEKKYNDILKDNKYPKLMFYICDILYGTYIYHLKNINIYKEIMTVYFKETRKHIPLFEKLKKYIVNCIN